MKASNSYKVSKQRACQWFGISRQSYYQARKRQLKRDAEDQMLIASVNIIRKRHPRMGGRKLLHKMQCSMTKLEIARGRDAFFDLLRFHNLLVAPKRSRRRTTRSGLWRCPNLFSELEVTHVNQAWVGDITYITTEEGFIYLALLTDAYSRFIVGYYLSSSLAAEGSLRALECAFKNASTYNLANLIHHSDHGIQYVSGDYRDLLQKNGISSSMGEVGNCYENALAERMNGILKDEYALDDLFVNFEHALAAVHDAIWLYNYDRPHLSLDMAIPADLYILN